MREIHYRNIDGLREWYIDVTDIVRSLFGESVIRADQVLSYEERDIAVYLSSRITYTDRINLRYGDVIVHFVNGNRIAINSSEWGYIQAIKEGERV